MAPKSAAVLADALLRMSLGRPSSPNLFNLCSLLTPLLSWVRKTIVLVGADFLSIVPRRILPKLIER